MNLGAGLAFSILVWIVLQSSDQGLCADTVVSVQGFETVGCLLESVKEARATPKYSFSALPVRVPEAQKYLRAIRLVRNCSRSWPPSTFFHNLGQQVAGVLHVSDACH